MSGGVRDIDPTTHNVPLELADQTILLTVLTDECAPVVPGMDTLGFAFFEHHAVEALLFADGEVVQRAILHGWGWEWTPTSTSTATLLVFDSSSGGAPGDEVITTTYFELAFDSDTASTGTWVGINTAYAERDCVGEATGTFSVVRGIFR